MPDDSMTVLSRWYHAPVRALDCVDDIAFAGAGGHLFKVRFAREPQTLKSVETTGRFVGLKVFDGLVYANEGKAGFKVYDLDLNLVQERPEWIHISGIAVNERFLILGDREQHSLRILERGTLEELARIDEGRHIGHFDLSKDWLVLSHGLMRRLESEGRRIFKALRLDPDGAIVEEREYESPEGIWKFRAFDGDDLYCVRQLSEPSHRAAGELALPDGPGQFVLDRFSFREGAPESPEETIGPLDGIPNDFILHEGMAWLTTRDRLVVYDLQDPSRSWKRSYEGGAGPIAASDERIFLSAISQDPKGLRTIELRDDGTIAETAHFHAPHDMEGVFIQGDYLYTATCRDGLRVFDISDPTDMRHIAWLDTPWLSEDIWVVEDRAYVADGHGLAIFDVGDPRQPCLVQYFQNPRRTMDKWVEGVRREGDYLYVAAHSDLRIFDVSDPDEAKEVAGLPVRRAKDLVVRDGLCHIAENPGYSVIDVSDPLNPREIAFLPLPEGIGFDVELKDNYAFVSMEGKGVYVIDFSDPGNPFVATSIHTGANRFQGVEVAGDFLYVATIYDQGVLKYDVSNPLDPTLVGKLDTPAGALNVKVRGDVMAIADYQGGVILGRP